MKKSYKLFIFDFDGTIGDTKEGIFQSFQEVLSKHGLPPVNREQIFSYMGLYLKEIFKKLTLNKYNDEFYEKLAADYNTLYKDSLKTKTLIYPEVADTLKKLKQKGTLNSIATSKNTELAELSCKYLHINKYFDFCIGGDRVTQKKPHPEMLLVTLNKLGVDYKDAVMIGDSTFDIEMGNAINMDTIAVTWGAHTKDQLKQTRPTYMIDNFSEIIKFIP
jgi:HAD superfamily hydrolase (TIGR01509 family)